MKWRSKVAALIAAALLALTLACSDLPNNGSCTGPACYSQEGHNP